MKTQKFAIGLALFLIMGLGMIQTASALIFEFNFDTITQKTWITKSSNTRTDGYTKDATGQIEMSLMNESGTGGGPWVWPITSAYVGGANAPGTFQFVMHTGTHANYTGWELGLNSIGDSQEGGDIDFPILNPANTVPNKGLYLIDPQQIRYFGVVVKYPVQAEMWDEGTADNAYADGPQWALAVGPYGSESMADLRFDPSQVNTAEPVLVVWDMWNEFQNVDFPSLADGFFKATGNEDPQNWWGQAKPDGTGRFSTVTKLQTKISSGITGSRLAFGLNGFGWGCYNIMPNHNYLGTNAGNGTGYDDANTATFDKVIFASKNPAVPVELSPAKDWMSFE